MFINVLGLPQKLIYIRFAGTNYTTISRYKGGWKHNGVRINDLSGCLETKSSLVLLTE